MSGTFAGFVLGCFVSALALNVGVKTLLVAIGHWLRLLLGF
ncbi:MAG TPA: hypothetical protein VF317_12895 [Dermatophilaceae bacterium]